MSITLKDRIVEDMKNAMRSHDKERLGTIRLMLAALKQREVDERIVLSDEQILVTLNKMIKQRRESITQYQAGNRADLAQKEEAEIQLIQTYLPAQLSLFEIEQAVTVALTETGATSNRDMGKVMSFLKTQLQGKADMTIVSNKVKEKLST